MGGFLGRTLGDLAEFRAEPERLVAEGETVMALIRFTGRRTSDLPGSSFRVAHVWTMRDGLATKHRFFLDPSKAERAFARSLVA